MVNQSWKNEERHGGCPIRQGQHFDILILAEQAFYKIAINGSHFCIFHHRLPIFTSSNFIAIEGDCTISYIGRESDYVAPTFNPPPNPVPPIVNVPPVYNPSNYFSLFL